VGDIVIARLKGLVIPEVRGAALSLSASASYYPGSNFNVSTVNNWIFDKKSHEYFFMALFLYL